MIEGKTFTLSVDGENTNVIDMSREREARTPHQNGPCRCVKCKHEWHGVAPEGALNLECPECHCMTGIFASIVLPREDVWECKCGNIFQCITRSGIVCVSCGQGKSFSELAASSGGEEG